MRRLKGESPTSPSKIPFLTPEQHAVARDIEGIISVIQQKQIDRERLQAIKKHLADNSAHSIADPIIIAAILGEFDYDCSKLDACLLFAKLAQEDLTILRLCLSSLVYFSDKMIFLKAAGKKMEDLTAIL